MERFVLDSNTVKDCAEPATAKFYQNRTNAGQQYHPGPGDVKKRYLDPEILHSECCDSAYGSECCSSTGSRFLSTGDVSESFQRLQLVENPKSENRLHDVTVESYEQSQINVESSERTVFRPALKRPAEEAEDVVLTSDAYDQDEEGDTPLSQSIIYEKPEIALKFIRYTEEPAFFNIRNCLGQTPLMLSVLTGQETVCRALVIAGASVDIQDKEGNTALHLACSMRKFGCVQALTSAINPIEIKQTLSARNCRLPQNLKLQLGLKNYEGLTCVHLGTFQGDCNLLAYLVAHGADINEPDGKSGRTALHYAVEMNQFNLVQSLINGLTVGANVDAVTFDLCTPLHLAAGRGHVDIAYLLHGAGADTQVQNFEGQCAFELADDRELQELITPCQHFESRDFYY